MRRNNWALHFVRDNEVEGLIRIKIFAGKVFAGSICQSSVDKIWRVNLFEDWDKYQSTDYFDGKQYKTLSGAKIAVSQWIRRNWSVNLEGGKKDA